jgi:catechol 2,3-dioxygenase-like lactoylglutathione lyase family enzyme
MQLETLIETSLYVDDPYRSEQFYLDVLGLNTILFNPRIVAMSVSSRHVLLLFQKGGSLEPLETPGGTIPPADAGGQMHVAFSVGEGELDRWEDQLRESGVEIESRVDWAKVPWEGRLPRTSGRSIYFRDPDAHLLELVTPGVWPGTY